MTNTLKGLIANAAGAVLALVVLFGIDLTPEQISGILLVLNSVLAIWIYMSRKQSPARSDDYEGRL